MSGLFDDASISYFGEDSPSSYNKEEMKTILKRCYGEQEIRRCFDEDREEIYEIQKVLVEIFKRFEEMPFDVTEPRKQELLASGKKEFFGKFFEHFYQSSDAIDELADLINRLNSTTTNGDELPGIAEEINASMIKFNNNAKMVREWVGSIYKETLYCFGYDAA